MNTPRKKTWLINCTEEEDCTKQSFKDECDMNNIVSRINKSGFILPSRLRTAFAARSMRTFPALRSPLEEAYAIVERADEAFTPLFPLASASASAVLPGFFRSWTTRIISKRPRTWVGGENASYPLLAAQKRPLLRLLSTERPRLRSSHLSRRHRYRSRPSRPKARRWEQ